MNVCKLILLITIVCLMLGCCQNNQVKSAHNQINKLNDSTVALVFKGDDYQYHAFCSGVWIAPNQILTAAHCARIQEQPEASPLGTVITFQTQSEVDSFKVHYALVTSYDKEVDLAVIKAVDELNHPSAKLSKQDNYQGDKVSIVGHTLGMPYSFVEGTISATRTIDGVKLFQVSTAAWKGNSGGAAFDSEGNIIGICSFLSSRTPNMVFFVHKEVIESFLAQSI